MNLSQNKKKAIYVLVIADYIATVAAWIIFWAYRQNYLNTIIPDLYPINRTWLLRDYVLGLTIIPCAWLFLYYLAGTYFDLYRKSRLVEIYRTIISCIIGASLIGFIAFANDTDSFKYFSQLTLWYFLTQTSLILIERLVILAIIKTRLRRQKVGYNTIIVGGNGKAASVYNEIKNNRNVIGNIIKGIVTGNNDLPPSIADPLPVLGSLDDLEKIIDKEHIEEVIIAVESHEHKKLERILIKLSNREVIVKVLPDLYDIISGSVRTSNVYDPVLITIHPELLPDWQKVCKRVFDISIALIATALLSPLMLYAAIRVMLSSPGTVIYRQSRVGLYGKPFHIYKFRSMYKNAESEGPALSSDEDPRITRWGRVMRKWRIDELPQFYNVLKGDMSLVGPRPERKHFIDIITQTHPHYKYLHRVKPGITSWGMVQYGYAENVSQMIERMKYDLLYIENCSLALDLKIILYTFKVLFQGRGK